MIDLKENGPAKEGPALKLAKFIDRRRYIIIVSWFAVCAASAYFFPSLRENVTFTFGPPHDSDSYKGRMALWGNFPSYRYVNQEFIMISSQSSTADLTAPPYRQPLGDLYRLIQKNLKEAYPKTITAPLESYYLLDDLKLPSLAEHFISIDKNVTLIVISHPRFQHTKDSDKFMHTLYHITNQAWETMGLQSTDLTWESAGAAAAEVENKNSLLISNLIILGASLPLAFMTLAGLLGCPMFVFLVILGFPPSTFVAFMVMHFVSAKMETPSFTPLLLMCVGLILQMANAILLCRDWLRARRAGLCAFNSMSYVLQSAGIVAFTTSAVLVIMFSTMSFLHYTPYLAISIGGMVCSAIAGAASLTLTPALLLCMGDYLMACNKKVDDNMSVLKDHVKKKLGMNVDGRGAPTSLPDNSEEKSYELTEVQDGNLEPPMESSPRDPESSEVAASPSRLAFAPEETEKMMKNKFWGGLAGMLSYPKSRQVLCVGLVVLPLLAISIFSIHMKGTANIKFLLPAHGEGMAALAKGSKAFKSNSYFYRYRIIFTADDTKYYPNGMLSEEGFATAQGLFQELLQKVPKFNINQILSPALLDGQFIPAASYADPAQTTGITVLNLLKGRYISANGKAMQANAYPDIHPDSEEGRAWTIQARQILKDYGRDKHIDIRLEGFGCSSMDTMTKAMATVPILGAVGFVAAFLVACLTLYNVTAALVTTLSVALSVATAYGFVTLVYQYGILKGMGPELVGKYGEVHWIPILICLPGMLAVGLNSSLYMAVKAIESHKEGASDQEALTRGLFEAGPVILLKNLVFVVALAGLFFAPLLAGWTIAVFFISFIVADLPLRLICEPLLLKIAGEYAWFPHKHKSLPKPSKA